MAVKMSQEEYIRKVKEKHPNVDTSKIKYINGRTKVDVKCNVCGTEWSPAATALTLAKPTGCLNVVLKIDLRSNLESLKKNGLLDVQRGIILSIIMIKLTM